MRAATLLGATLLVALTGFACERAGQSAGSEKTAGQSAGSERTRPTPADSSSAAAPKRIDLTYDRTKTPKPIVGTSVEATAEGLPPNKTLDLVWGSVDGGWVIEDYFHFRGKKYTETTRPLSQVSTDARG